MRCQSIILAVLASVALAAPTPKPDNDCIGSSFSPTNCDSPNAQSIDVSPDLNISPSIGRRQPDGGDTVGSSFSPTNNDSPGAQSIDVSPDVNVSPDINLKERSPDNDCIGSSFSPTNCDSPGAQSIDVDPSIDVSPVITLPDLNLKQ